VLANDTDPGGDLLVAILVQSPGYGDLSLSENGSFVYTPNGTFIGRDSFGYVPFDLQARGNRVTVTIDVTNAAPVAVDDSFTVKHDRTTVLAPTYNDTDADGDTLNPTVLSGPQHGTLEVNADGTIDYTPNFHYLGPDEFTYRVNDGFADSDTATVTIDVVNHAPVAGDDNYTIKHSRPFAFDVLLNDSDEDQDDHWIVLDSTVSHGTLTIEEDGTFTYQPITGYLGLDKFTYHLEEDLANSSLATVTFNVTNAAPVAEDDFYSTNHDRPLAISPQNGYLDNDYDADGDPMEVTLLSSPSHGRLTPHEEGAFVYEPDPSYFGPDSFTYQLNDGLADSEVATVHISIIDTAPLGVDTFRYRLYDGLQYSAVVMVTIGVLQTPPDALDDTLDLPHFHRFGHRQRQGRPIRSNDRLVGQRRAARNLGSELLRFLRLYAARRLRGTRLVQLPDFRWARLQPSCDGHSECAADDARRRRRLLHDRTRSHAEGRLELFPVYGPAQTAAE
jgi:VCBS repeat-containing protein